MQLKWLQFISVVMLSSHSIASDNKVAANMISGELTKKTLPFAVPESIRFNVEKQAYCLLNKTFSNMGYQIKQVEHPLIRAFTETRKGNMALVLVGIPNFKTGMKPKTTYQGIVLTSTPFLTTAVSFYKQSNSILVMDSADWLTNYRIGLVRNIYTHDIQSFSTKDNNNYHFYINSLSAFKALTKGRVDIVISSEFDYLSASSSLNIQDVITNFMTIGTANLYPGFSHQYFGEDNAKGLAELYDLERNKLSESELALCAQTSKTDLTSVPISK